MHNEKTWAVFLDIDKTLTVEDNIVPQKNLAAIKAARKAGHKVFINTGRSWGNIPQKLFDQLEVDGFIAGNGVHIVLDGKTLLREKMEMALCRRVCDYCLSHDGIWCMFECLGACCIVNNSLLANHFNIPTIESLQEFDSFMLGNEVQVISAGKIIPQDFHNAFGNEMTIIQFPDYADCCIKGYSKATGIEALLPHIGVEREHTMAIGDSGNDYEMLKYCAVGVAMADSEQKLIDIADFVTLSNTEAGVAHAIIRYLN